jgi:hypothetical protein
MVTELPIKEPEQVSCAACQLEIPRAESLSIEGKEYAYHFCGHGCYTRWNTELGERKNNTKPDAPGK